MWTLEYFKICQGDLGKSIYICHKSAFNLFEDIVLKIELPERSDVCARDVAHMLVQYHHICHSLVVSIWSVDRCCRQMSFCTVCPVHTL